MTPFFSDAEGSLLVRLLLAHFITDFLLQPGKWVRGKNAQSWRSKYFWYHILLTGAVAWLFAGSLHYLWAIVAITISHLLIDAGKIACERKLNSSNPTKIILFLTDQLLHVIVIVVVWLAMIHGWHRMYLLAQKLLPDYRIWIRLLGYILMVGPVG